MWQPVISFKQTNTRQIIQTIFEVNGSQIIVKLNIKIGNYLDVTSYLNDVTKHSFRKPNLRKIIKKIPRSVEKRLFELSSINKIFENSKEYHEQGLQQKVKLYRRKQRNKFKCRKSNICWFKLPYIKSVKTSVNFSFF